MAVDTAQKRAAVLRMAMGPLFFPLLVPDSSIDARDRAALAGFALPTTGPVDPPSEPGIGTRLLFARRRGLR